MRNKNDREVKLNPRLTYYSFILVIGICLLSLIIYKYMKHRTLSEAFLEIILLLVLVVFAEYGRFYLLDRKINQKKITKKNRIRGYFKHSIILALLLTTIISLAILFDKIFINFYNIFLGNIIGSILLVIGGVFLISFVLIFVVMTLICERKNVK